MGEGKNIVSKREFSHRKIKREKEMLLVINYLRKYQEVNNGNILEFGCGDGFQIPFLKLISDKVDAIDVIVENSVSKKYSNIVSAQSIDDTSFKTNQFDLIFSNHVIEHLEDLQGAVEEMKRIGSDKCIYVFSVPTNIWLLLSIPAQYFRKIKHFRQHLQKSDNSSANNKNSKNFSFLSKIVPKGHGEYLGFVECYKAFRIKSWHRLFKSLGFNAVQVEPLLLYSASEFPVCPTTAALSKLNICSSVLFILRVSE